MVTRANIISHISSLQTHWQTSCMQRTEGNHPAKKKIALKLTQSKHHQSKKSKSQLCRNKRWSEEKWFIESRTWGRNISRSGEQITIVNVKKKRRLPSRGTTALCWWNIWVWVTKHFTSKSATCAGNYYVKMNKDWRVEPHLKFLSQWQPTVLPQLPSAVVGCRHQTHLYDVTPVTGASVSNQILKCHQNFVPPPVRRYRWCYLVSSNASSTIPL